MRTWKDIAVALSLANLCFFGVWSSLLGDFRDPFARLRLSPPAEYAGAILNVLSLAAAFYLAIFSLRRRFRRWKLAGVLCAMAALTWAPAAACYTVLTRYRPRPSLAALPLPGNTVVLIAALAVLLLLLLLPHHHRRIAAMLYGVLLIFSPFVGVTFARAGWRMYAAKQGPPLPPPTAPAVPETARAQPASRVVWIVFDEWDQRLTFEQRPEALDLPELDRLRSEVLYASAAYAPAEQTPYSMLSTIAGGVLLRLEAERGPQLRLVFRDHPEAVLWSEHLNLFRRARRQGFRTAVVGWYIPYCVLLSDSLDSCWQSDPLSSSGGSSLSRVLAGQWQIVVKKAVFSVSPESLDALHHSQLFDQMLAEAFKALTDASLDLVLLHLPVPHGPYFYDRQTGTYRFDMDPVLAYFDALALVDRTVGQFRRRLEAAGLWDQTALLLTSDHWLRTSELIDGIKEHRVPFLLKLAGKSRPAVYEHAFNTVLSHDLMLEILGGRLRTAAAVMRWLDQHRESVSIEPVYTGLGPQGS
jgi:hypothetical protein